MAGYRPRDWHVLDLEKDPTPGDPDRVRSLAKTLHDFADDVSEALRLVNGMAGEGTMLEWVGKSAAVFQEEFSGVPKNLKKLKKSYELCGDALADFWPKLERAQALADRALARAREAQADLSSAQSRLSSADSWVTRANKEADRYKDDPTGSTSGAEKPDEAKVRAATRDAQQANSAHAKAQSDVSDAQDALDAAKKMAEDARTMREEAARDAKSKIDEASDAGIQNRSWWEEVGDWFTDNWDTIVAACKIVVAVLGIVAMIIGGPILGAIVLIAALVVLADTLYKYSKGQASLWDVGLAALDCIPGMKGLTSLGGLAKGLKALGKTGLKGMALGVKGLGKSVGAMSRQMKKLFCRTDPVDMATGEVVMSSTDVSLPGVLPLALERHHRSGVRTGRLFGVSWMSTLDQRLVLDSAGVRFATADGMVLQYPVPDSDTAVLPVAGPRWPLTWDGSPEGELVVRDTEAERMFHFRPLPGGPAGELLLAAISDHNGNTMTVHYGPEGEPRELEHTGGYRLGVTCEEGRITELTLRSHPEQPTLMQYGYDGSGNLIEIHNSGAQPLRFAYDSRRRITGWQDRNGVRYRYDYDDQGRCVLTRGAEGFLNSEIVYESDGSRTLFTDSLGHTTVYDFDDRYQLITETDPLGGRTHRTWDEHGNLLTITDALGRTTTYAYDRLGRITAATRPDGQRLSVDFHELGMPERITHADGTQWEQTFDEAGNRTAVVDPAGGVVRFAYDGQGGLVSSTDPAGNTTEFVCDAAGLPVRVVTPLGETTAYRRDAFGHPVEIIAPGGAVTRLEWTNEGRPLRHVDPLGSQWSWTWDGEGNCLSRTDAAGAVHRYEYGPFDALRAQTNPDGSRFEFERDTELRLAAVTSALGLRWQYTYDAAGRLVEECDFDDRTVRYGYDPAGQLTARGNALGQQITYVRDDLGRIREKDVAGARTVFEYDPSGRLLQAAGPDAELTFERDPLGRILTEVCDGRATSYAYDSLGRLTQRRTPSGAESHYDYDPLGRPVSLLAGDHRLDFTYDPTGRESMRRLERDVVLQHAWDAAGNLSHQTAHSQDRMLWQRTFSYRDDHHLTKIADSRRGETTFDLDALGRVTGVASPNGRESYAYDAVGNQLAAGWPAEHEAMGDRAYSGTRLVRAGRARYQYDQAGRTVLRRKRSLSGKAYTWTYEWDAEDRLIAVITPDGTRWRYLYDPLGRRVSKQRLTAEGGVAEEVRFTWFNATLVEQTSRIADNEAETEVLTWDYRDQQPLAQRRRLTQPEVDTRFYAVVTDLVGTPTELVDDTGDIAWQADSTLWGVNRRSTDTSADIPLRFPGQYHDPETGWHYNYQRHYDPAIARYTTPDPLGLEADPNHYGYVDNPHSWIDPLGLLSCTGRLDKLNPGEIYLYRAVMDGELGQIMRTRTFQNPRGIETKYFSTTAEAAAAYAREMFSRFPQEGAYTLVRSTVRTDAIPEISRVDLVEAGGIEALALPTEVLEQMGRIRILPSMPIP
ncbi:Rhs protein [Streptomyces sp. HUCO-GS316]|uniref:RHS repeat-associated core domain-containing protein n=1 Tax=Streptomyces sp. HUCO-GS316 TaxID=2692198 RepID=UPI001370CF4B|nr:RHS repeat-associated core domain-containing protein [Streptomyces sp. HUCO-GS316]MXM62309.1 Rhs protein [Streptomyces sp. HUCO-GS316]